MSFHVHLSRHLEDHADDLTRRWVDTLEGQLRDVDHEDVLPTDELLNHIPAILERVSEYVGDPDEQILEAMVVQDLMALADMRRRQGFGLQEVLREYHLLSEIVQEEAEAAADTWEGPVEPRQVVRSVGRLKDAIHLLGAVTARSYRAWAAREERERGELFGAWGHMLAHELGNRLGAAETAIRFLDSGVTLPDSRVEELHALVLRSIHGALQTMDDIRVLATPPGEADPDATIGLPLLVKEAVRQAKLRCSEDGIDLRLVGEVPSVRVPGGPVRLVLVNLVTNAFKYHRPHGDDRWIEVRSEIPEQAAGAGGPPRLEMSVEDNGPGIPPHLRRKVFDYRVRGDVDEEGSGLGLAIARDAVERMDGEIGVEEGRETGARFWFRIPVAERD